MRRCVIHIGVPKTGSSTIQRQLLRHTHLLRRAGILYQTTDDPARKVFAHHRMAAGLRPGEKPERLPGFKLSDLDGLLAATRSDTVVLSSEGFSHPRVSRDRLREMIGMIRARGFAPTAVVYVRAQPSLANSSYTQAIKTFAFPGSVAEFLDKRMSDVSWTYGERLAPWIGELGVELVAVPFTAETTGPLIAEKMLAFAGVPADQLAAVGMKPAGTANKGPGRVAIAAFRLLMRAYPDFGQARRRSAAREAAAKDAKARGWYVGRFLGLDDATARRIETAYEADNEAFAQRQWGRPWTEVFAAEAERPWRSNEIDIDRPPPALAAELEAFVSAHR